MRKNEYLYNNVITKYMEHIYICIKGLSEYIHILCQYNSVSLIVIVNNNIYKLCSIHIIIITNFCMQLRARLFMNKNS